MQHHLLHKHIENRPTCRTIITEIAERLYAKDVVNIHRMLNRRIKKSRAKTCTSRRGHSRKQGITGLSNPPWEVNGLNHTLGFLAWGELSTRRTSPLTWFENQWDWQWVYKKSRLCSWRVYIHSLYSWRKGGGRRVKLSRFWLVSHGHHRLEWIPTPAPLAHQCSSTQGWRVPWPRRVKTVGYRAGSDPAQHLNRVRIAITGAHRGTRSGAVQSPDCILTIPVSTLGT